MSHIWGNGGLAERVLGVMPTYTRPEALGDALSELEPEVGWKKLANYGDDSLLVEYLDALDNTSRGTSFVAFSLASSETRPWLSVRHAIGWNSLLDHPYFKGQQGYASTLIEAALLGRLTLERLGVLLDVQTFLGALEQVEEEEYAWPALNEMVWDVLGPEGIKGWSPLEWREEEWTLCWEYSTILCKKLVHDVLEAAQTPWEGVRLLLTVLTVWPATGKEFETLLKTLEHIGALREWDHRSQSRLLAEIEPSLRATVFCQLAGKQTL